MVRYFNILFSIIWLIGVSTILHAQTWTPIGPGGVLNGQASTTPNTVSGAVQSILISPTDSNTMYVGTVNGGIWKTTNAGSSWTATTDSIGSLSIGALTIDPLTAGTIVAGIGRSSSYYREGGSRIGLTYSTDGGSNWMSINTLTGGADINGVASRNLRPGNGTLVVAVDTADSNFYSNVGIFRSTNGGTSWTHISGGSSTGLPNMTATGLFENPSNQSQLFTATHFVSGGTAGLYRSDDTGSTWSLVGNATINTAIASSSNVKVSANGTNVIVGIINSAGALASVWRSIDSGTNWTQVANTPVSNPGSQGDIHFNLLLDPTDATGNRAYLCGDRANSSPFNGQIYRGDLTAGTWTSIAINGTNAPHADCRSLAINPTTGNLVNGNDGGLFSLPNPSGPIGNWTSLNAGLGTLEVHRVAYDPVSKLAFGGTQDNGTVIQTSVGNNAWTNILGGDGADVAVVKNPSNSSQSLRYYSSQYLGSGTGFFRAIYNNSGTVVSSSAAGLIVAGSGGQNVHAYEVSQSGGTHGTVGFYAPIATNRADGERLYIGTRRLYESTDRGANLTMIQDFGSGNSINIITAGGFAGTTAKPLVLYVGANNGLWLRPDTGGALVQRTAYTGGSVIDIAIQSDNWLNATIASSAQVFRTTDSGVIVTNITGDLITGHVNASTIFCIETMHFGAKDYFLAGTRNGVYISSSDALGTWTLLGSGLPTNVIADLDYDALNDTLLAADLGRGIWTITAFSTNFPIPEPATLFVVGILILGLVKLRR